MSKKEMMKKLQEKIEKGRKLAEEFRAMGLNVDFNEETGEVLIQGSEFTKNKDC